jgi:uncharacterized protein involved in tellurium resistance
MTEKEKLEWSQAMDSWEKHKKTRALKALFEKDSIDYDLGNFNYLLRVFCWFKTLICLLFNRTNGSYLDRNKFCILSYDESSGGEYQSWDACWVSPYLFKDWNVCLASDGT